MKREIDKKKAGTAILYGVIAVLVFAAVWFVTFSDRGQLESERRVWALVMGDSIPGECRDETSVTAHLERLLDKPVLNGSLGGTYMSRLEDGERLAYTKDCLSMQAFSLAFAAQDFGPQQTVFIREPATEYFAETIDGIAAVDYDKLKVLVIEHGINDYHAGVPIDNPEDPYDIYTFKGALRSSVEILQKAYPDLKIVLVTPTYSWYLFNEVPELTCEENDLGGGVLEDYVNAEIELAQELNVEIVDLYHDFYPHENWSDWELYTIDGVHPNEAGRKMIADALYECLQNL